MNGVDVEGGSWTDMGLGQLGPRGIALGRETHGAVGRAQACGRMQALVPAPAGPALWPGAIHQCLCLSLSPPYL